MRNILITGGTVFVSRSLAEYFVEKGDNVFVLNRNTRPQVKGVTLIEADRYDLGNELSNYDFDVVIDANSYTGEEVNLLLDGLSNVVEYVFISSSAVYPDTSPQPFTEQEPVGDNKYWKSYGTNKIEAEQVLNIRVPQAYILRPAYIYGPHNNAYREAFVFDRAKNKLPFYIPGNGLQKLQFIHIKDLCRLIDNILEQKPNQKIYNVGNQKSITIKEWVELCYETVDVPLDIINVKADIVQSTYFSFSDYQYELDVSNQTELIGDTCDFKEGLKESWQWYQENEEAVSKVNYNIF